MTVSDHQQQTQEGPFLELLLQGCNLVKVPSLSYKPSWEIPKEEPNPNRLYRISKFQPGDDEQVYRPVYESEVVRDTTNPLWSKVRLSLQQVCNGDCDLPLQISLWECGDKGLPTVPMGCCDTTVTELIRAASPKHPNVLSMYRGDRFMGKVIVLKAVIREEQAKDEEEEEEEEDKGAAFDWWGVFGGGSNEEQEETQEEEKEEEENGWANGWGALEALVGFSNDWKEAIEEEETDSDEEEEDTVDDSEATNEQQEDNSEERERYPLPPGLKRQVTVEDVLSVARQTVTEVIKKKTKKLQQNRPSLHLEQLVQQQKEQSANDNRAQQILNTMDKFLLDESGKDWIKDQQQLSNKRFQEEQDEVLRFSNIWNDAFWEKMAASLDRIPEVQHSLEQLPSVTEGMPPHEAEKKKMLQVQQRLTDTHAVLVHNLQTISEHGTKKKKHKTKRKPGTDGKKHKRRPHSSRERSPSPDKSKRMRDGRSRTESGSQERSSSRSRSGRSERSKNDGASRERASSRSPDRNARRDNSGRSGRSERSRAKSDSERRERSSSRSPDRSGRSAGSRTKTGSERKERSSSSRSPERSGRSDRSSRSERSGKSGCSGRSERSQRSNATNSNSKRRERTTNRSSTQRASKDGSEHGERQRDRRKEKSHSPQRSEKMAGKPPKYRSRSAEPPLRKASIETQNNIMKELEAMGIKLPKSSKQPTRQKTQHAKPTKKKTNQSV